MTDHKAYLPGRLADPAATLVDDPRLDPRIAEAVKAMAEYAPEMSPPAENASYEDCLAFIQQIEEISESANEQARAGLAVPASIENSTESIPGVDGNEITLHIHRPRNAYGQLPCVVHMHGGGMVMMSTQEPMFLGWRYRLAEAGLLVIGVEFRNGGGALGNHPFPAGLNDCASAVQWVHTNREKLGISSLIVSGESGGGNLSVATALKAKKEGWLDHIDGVFAMCPYICGRYLTPPPELLSLYENDGYGLGTAMLELMAKVYDPAGDNLDDPLAWPFNATPEDMAGLPPHVVSVNELDPLRDEGLAYYRNLVRAGVPAVARTLHGIPHGGDLAYGALAPEYYQDTLRSLHGFALSLV